MNERIRELAVEADFALFVDGHFYSECQNEMITDQIQKFAELIIKDQQREWVGLTDDEVAWCQAPTTTETWKRIEAKLKERNT